MLDKVKRSSLPFLWLRKKVLQYQDCFPGSTVAKHSTNDPEMESSNPATVVVAIKTYERKKRKFFDKIDENLTIVIA